MQNFADKSLMPCLVILINSCFVLQFDNYYVGTPPPNEVTFTNLNDNINKDFLENMCKGFGKIEEVKIYYNPKNRKHMGIGKVWFIFVLQCDSKCIQHSFW